MTVSAFSAHFRNAESQKVYVSLFNAPATKWQSGVSQYFNKYEKYKQVLQH